MARVGLALACMYARAITFAVTSALHVLRQCWHWPLPAPRDRETASKSKTGLGLRGNLYL